MGEGAKSQAPQLWLRLLSTAAALASLVTMVGLLASGWLITEETSSTEVGSSDQDGHTEAAESREPSTLREPSRPSDSTSEETAGDGGVVTTSTSPRTQVTSATTMSLGPPATDKPSTSYLVTQLVELTPEVYEVWGWTEPGPVDLLGDTYKDSLSSRRCHVSDRGDKIVYALNQDYEIFSAIVGLIDGTPGAVKFDVTILVDDSVAFSGSVDNSEPIGATIDVSRKETLSIEFIGTTSTSCLAGQGLALADPHLVGFSTAAAQEYGGWMRLPVDNISSFETSGCVQFYGTQYSTEQYNDTLCASEPDLSGLPESRFEKNDRFFYAKVECGHLLAVFEDANYEGANGIVAANC